MWSDTEKVFWCGGFSDIGFSEGNEIEVVKSHEIIVLDGCVFVFDKRSDVKCADVEGSRPASRSGIGFSVTSKTE